SIYLTVFNGQTNTIPDAPTWDPNVKNLYFHLNVDKLVRMRLFQIQRMMKAPPTVSGPFISFTDSNIYQRDVNGKLYKLTPTGEKEYFDMDGEGTKKTLVPNFKCYSSLLKL